MLDRDTKSEDVERKFGPTLLLHLEPLHMYSLYLECSSPPSSPGVFSPWSLPAKLSGSWPIHLTFVEPITTITL